MDVFGSIHCTVYKYKNVSAGRAPSTLRKPISKMDISNDEGRPRSLWTTRPEITGNDDSIPKPHNYFMVLENIRFQRVKSKFTRYCQRSFRKKRKSARQVPRVSSNLANKSNTSASHMPACAVAATSDQRGTSLDLERLKLSSPCKTLTILRLSESNHSKSPTVMQTLRKYRTKEAFRYYPALTINMLLPNTDVFSASSIGEDFRGTNSQDDDNNGTSNECGNSEVRCNVVALPQPEGVCRNNKSYNKKKTFQENCLSNYVNMLIIIKENLFQSHPLLNKREYDNVQLFGFRLYFNASLLQAWNIFHDREETNSNSKLCAMPKDINETNNKWCVTYNGFQLTERDFLEDIVTRREESMTLDLEFKCDLLLPHNERDKNTLRKAPSKQNKCVTNSTRKSKLRRTSTFHGITSIGPINIPRRSKSRVNEPEAVSDETPSAKKTRKRNPVARSMSFHGFGSKHFPIPHQHRRLSFPLRSLRLRKTRHGVWCDVEKGCFVHQAAEMDHVDPRTVRVDNVVFFLFIFSAYN